MCCDRVAIAKETSDCPAGMQILVRVRNDARNAGRRSLLMVNAYFGTSGHQVEAIRERPRSIRDSPEIGFVPSGPARARVQPQNGFVPSTAIIQFRAALRRRRIGNSLEIGFVFGGQTAPSRSRLGQNILCLQVVVRAAGPKNWLRFLPGHIVLPNLRRGACGLLRHLRSEATVRERGHGR